MTKTIKYIFNTPIRLTEKLMDINNEVAVIFAYNACQWFFVFILIIALLKAITGE